MSEYGLHIWYAGRNPEVDIVFVHGLRGNREKTWRKNGVVWPKQLLSQDIQNSRIMTFGHDARIVHSDPDEVTQGSLDTEAAMLCSQLQARRFERHEENRPIIFVAHSLGGLICAQAIVHGELSKPGDCVMNISDRVKGIVFLGTPFGGSALAGRGELARRVVSVVKKTDKTTMRVLSAGSADRQALHDLFPRVVQKRMQTPRGLELAFFCETIPTRGSLVVESDSASIYGLGRPVEIQADHAGMCKFDSRDDVGYQLVRQKILHMIDHARRPAETHRR
ncbi:Alpha/Beta hydrolase protein [Thelonectria olida]|uniref:Alpha/Beta hydrolase protein n=1 Tax=Thelonectria olida TaxID=1576542 RepID=A0A9P9AM28_9HYPO|nr:Alpha/Beta hydrolase protein [Thelonectria olida]